MRPLAILLLFASAAAGQTRLGDDGYRVGRKIDDAVLSPDGRTFAVVAGPGVFLLDASTGHVAGHWDEASPIQRIDFDHAGRLLLLDRDGSIRRYDVATGRVDREWRLGPALLAQGEFHAGGRVFTAARSFGIERPRRADNTLFLDLEAGRPLAWADDLWIDQTWALSGDGRRLAVARNGPRLVPLLGLYPNKADLDRVHHLLRVLDPDTGREVCRRHKPGEEVGPFAFAPDGRTLVVTIHPRVVVIDVETGTERELKLDGRPADLPFGAPFVVAPDGRRLACRETELEPTLRTVVREWDLATGQLLARHDAPGRGHHRIGYTPAGRLLVWNTHGCRLDVTDIHTGPILPTTGHAAPLRSVAFSADGRLLVTTDEADAVCRWDLVRGGVEHATASAGSAGAVTSPDGRWVVPLPMDCDRPVLRDNTGRESRLPPTFDLWPGCRRGATPPVFSPDGRLLAEVLVRATDAETQHVRLGVAVYDTATVAVRGRIELATRERTGGLLFAPDGRSLLLGHDRGVSRFDLATGRLVQALRAGGDGLLVPLAVSPDSRCLLALAGTGWAAYEGELRLIELATGSTRRGWPWPQHRASAASPCFSPDGRTVALPLDDGTVTLLPTDSAAAVPPSDALWDALASPDAAVAGAAVLALAGRPDAGEWVRERTATRAEVDDHSAAYWLAELDHDDPARREAAVSHLAQRPEAVGRLRAALSGAPSVALAETLRQLGEESAALKVPSPDRLRRLRLDEVRERLRSASP